MKQFTSFMDAIRFRAECPVCAKKLEINDRDLTLSHAYDEQGEHRLSFYLNQREDDIITVDMLSDKVEIELRDRLPTTIYTAAQAALGPPPVSAYPSIPAKFMHGLTIDCKSCCQYSYNIQIHFDLKNSKIDGIYLNSENVSVEEGDMVHEIRNVYATEQTEYSCFPRDGSSRRSSIPLIPLDLTKLKETVSRIRKLLIFS